VDVTALQTEAELAWQEPERPSSANAPIGFYQKLSRLQVAMRALEPGLAAGRRFDPGLGVVHDLAGEVQIAWLRIAKQEAQALALRVIVGVGVFLALVTLTRHVVDVSSEQHRTTLV